MEGAGRRNGGGGARTRTGGTQSRRRIPGERRSSRAGCKRGEAQGGGGGRGETANGRSAISSGKLWAKRAGEVGWETISARRRARFIATRLPTTAFFRRTCEKKVSTP